VDVTPRASSGRQLINAYGDGGFRIAGVAHRGSVLVLPERTLPWPVAVMAELTLAGLEPLLEAGPLTEILLIGCGAAIAFIPKPLREALRARHISVDGMNTGAACRTYNVLLAEDRRVAAALIAVD
jgi:uncharacterized protein